MAFSRFVRPFASLCMTFLLLSPTEAFYPVSMNLPRGSITDLLAASFIGAVLGGVHHHAKQQKQQQEQDNQASAQHQHPVFLPMPWHAPPQHHQLPHQPLPRHPLQNLLLPMTQPMMQPFRAHPHPPPMPMIHPEMAPWIPQQAFAQLHPFQHPVMAGHPHLQGLHSFERMEQIPHMHPWHPMSQAASILHRLDLTGHFLDHKMMQ